MKKVVILNIILPQYRYDFFTLLKEVLLKNDVELEVIYGKEKSVDALKKDEVDIEWAKFIPNKIFKIGKTKLIWQTSLSIIKDTDLVIVENANKLLLNYYLIFTRRFSKYKLAFWGHGRNLQDHVDSLPNRFKYLFLNKCDWWFGYTNLTKRILRSQNYPLNRITVVQNAIDTSCIKKYYSEIKEPELINLQNELGMTGSIAAIYCGAMYPEKNFDFILETCYRVKRQIPNFHMIFMGSGIEAEKIIAASKSHNWIHYVGSKFGTDRVKYFKISRIQLMPYFVGLGIVDSFAMETPIVTTSNTFHGPEIDYLDNGKNGIVTNDNIDDYSLKVVETLKNESYLKLIDGCKLAAEKITLEVMVDNFKNGILSCLKTQKK